MISSAPKIKFSIDRGGTFTDVYGEDFVNNIIYTEKLLSVDPSNYPDAPREGIRRILVRALSTELSATLPIPTANIHWIRMGTTVATNALLERKGTPTALAVTKGFADLLAIGDQTRPDLFDLKILKPELLYSEVFEIDERVRLARNEDFNLHLPTVKGTGGENYIILKEPDRNMIHSGLEKIYNKGIKNLSVVCMHGYSFHLHEQIVADIARKIGFEHISLSHQTIPQIKIVARGDTCLVDGYLTPHIKEYLESFRSGFHNNLNDIQLLFMQSDGSLRKASDFKGYNAILSGPAGGVVGCGRSAYPMTGYRPIIAFDMGGTSTDVSRYGGEYELTQSTRTAGVRIQCPQMYIKTVAAGGGSRLFYRNGMLQVGPESAGAHPGPVCYRKGGYLTITDANLFLGRIQPEFFPAIFGPEENQPLDTEGVSAAFHAITETINGDAKRHGLPLKSPQEVALGFIQVANETMIRPIREISIMRGYDIKEHVLSCFGGAGGQHGCEIATALGIDTVFIHLHSGILSALGISLADISIDKQESANDTLSTSTVPILKARLCTMEKLACTELKKQYSGHGDIDIKHFLNLRFQGTDNPIMVQLQDGQNPSDTFRNKYKRQYGFILQDRDIKVDDIRVRVSTTTTSHTRQNLEPHENSSVPVSLIDCYFHGGYRTTPVYRHDDITPGSTTKGPALIIQDGSTILATPGTEIQRNLSGDLVIKSGDNAKRFVTAELDPVQLAIFSNLFMSVGEQMGRTLQKNAVSTNIKERLDFSCAVFDPEGGLVANAPHIPVHLGAMGEAVKRQVELNFENIKEGDVFLANHPAAGGSHLPDFTVITPVWKNGKIVFFLANRGHHADIGGITPGSMPPFSTKLAEEGAAVMTMKIIENGLFQENSLIKALTDFEDLRHHPPIYRARRPADNISDIKAQIAANRVGSDVLIEMIDKYGLDVVQAYMDHIQNNASEAVRNMLKQVGKRNGSSRFLTLRGKDFLDDGTLISLKVEIDQIKGEAVFDFSDTDDEIKGNLNCPPAVVKSAILYCLRCLIGEDIPLNQGCLEPVTIITRKGSILNPSADAAVVGGNVLTSQRIVDVIFKAFTTAADSQGCTNNLTFGGDDFGYYETIGGGAGAGPGYHGQSGVHTHMTNTRITDPEVLEKRYPVMLREFSIRRHSGGNGRFRGGDGLTRHIEALSPLQVSILSERRNLPPNGIAGGENGTPGRNMVFLKEEKREIDIGGKNSILLKRGDSIRIQTPGGGGYGAIDEIADKNRKI